MDYITKPFSPEEVLARIRTHLTLGLIKFDLECRTAELEKKNLELEKEMLGRKEAEESLRESEAQKQAILDGITSNIAFVNEDLEIMWVNKTAAESVGKTPGQMIGRKCHSFGLIQTNPVRVVPR